MAAEGRPGMIETVRVVEIFCSIQGESSFAGWPCIMVRLAGCPLSCRHCDTGYAREEAGEEMTLDAVMERVRGFPGVVHAELTGGEPLDQPAALPLLARLCDDGLTVLLETSGALSIAGVDPRVRVIMDLKAPSSGMAHRMRLENLDLLGPKDELKLVLAGREDYAWARELLAERQPQMRCTVLMSPIHGELEPGDLAAWILEDQLPVRMQVQLHKVIWPEADRGV